MQDLTQLTDDELAQYMKQRKEELALLTKLNPSNPDLRVKGRPKLDGTPPTRRRPMPDPEYVAAQLLRVKAKIAGRNERQWRAAVERRETSSAEYQQAVVDYCRERDLAELPVEFSRELGQIYTFHNTPSHLRDQLEFE